MTNTIKDQLVAVLAALDIGEYDIDTSLVELASLAESAGYLVNGWIIQRREQPVTSTFMGKGRLEELREYIANNECDLVIFDHELSPAQLRNIENICNCPVMDRTMLILDIFASRAVSSEGKLQVELARLQYQLPRLQGKGVQLSRQGGGGGGGTGARRGAGESKLETDRRHIRRRITVLKEDMKDLEARRKRYRERRKKDNITTVAIVGYTNVGKSTLLNSLTEAGVLAEDKLFATLDPTARALTLPHGQSIMLVDTVGLVRRLPHQLVEAFHSTLEEAVCADCILNVCDISDPNVWEQKEVTEKLLADLEISDTPVITVLNKCDSIDESVFPIPFKDCIRISAKTGKGFDTLLQTIQEHLTPSKVRIKVLLPYSEGSLLNRLESSSEIISREFTSEGTLVSALVDQPLLQIFNSYLVNR